MPLRSYPEYRDSGLPWLGEIPAHWKKRRLKFVFREIDDRSDTGQETLLSMRQHIGLVPHNDVSDKEITSETLTGYKRTCENDVVMNRMRASIGMFARTSEYGLVSPDYAVLRPLDGADTEYFVHLFKSPLMRTEFRAESKGLGTGTAGFLRLYFDRFGAIAVPLPPREEQEKIVAYLSVRDRQIARLIRAKQRLIELLTEQKQAIIHRAVTRGLDPDTKMKPTGLDWLPEVPEGWEVKKLRHLVKLNPSKSESVQSSVHANGIVFLPMERVSEDGNIDCSERRTLGEVWNGFSYFRRDDVIVAKITPCFENGKGAHLGLLESEFGFGSTEFVVLRAGSRISAEYLYQITASPMFRKLGEQAMTGAAGQQRITNDFVKNFSVALPPTEEQKEILSFIASETQTIDKAIERARREIDLIREYRTRLVSDVVTGRLDVRGTDLPEVEDIKDTPGFEEPLPPMLDDLVEESRAAP